MERTCWVRAAGAMRELRQDESVAAVRGPAAHDVPDTGQRTHRAERRERPRLSPGDLDDEVVRPGGVLPAAATADAAQGAGDGRPGIFRNLNEKPAGDIGPRRGRSFLAV